MPPLLTKEGEPSVVSHNSTSWHSVFPLFGLEPVKLADCVDRLGTVTYLSPSRLLRQ